MSDQQNCSRKRVKLTGRKFYESLGSPKMVLAPMVDQSEFAWRLLTRSFMPEAEKNNLLAYTPMIHARLFNETQKYRDRSFQATDPNRPSNTPYLDGNVKFDRPLFVQFCANDPDEFLQAAKLVAPYCDAVDLNLGCPQGIARKGKYGAFLQEEPDLIYDMIRNLDTNLDIPVTAKIRILESREKTLHYAKKVLSAGASILTVHGRQRDQKGHNTGLADWAVLRYLRDELPADTVLFANGNILQHTDIARCLEATGFDGVMSAEGNLCDPSIFASPPPPDSTTREYWRGHNGRGGWRMDAAFRRYMDIIYQYVLEQDPPSRTPLYVCSDGNPRFEDPTSSNDFLDEEPRAKKRRTTSDQKKTSSPSLLAMQPHLFHLLRSLVAKHTNVRDHLAKCRSGDIQAFEHVLQLTERAIAQGLQEYESDPAQYDEKEVEQMTENERWKESSLETVRQCKRPWWICQPYIRPLPHEALAKGSMTLSKKDKKRKEKEEQEAKAAAAVRAKSAETMAPKSDRELLDIEDGLAQRDVARGAMVAG